MNLQSYGFPDCGNLRSTKRKDVRSRLNCIQLMLKQRIKDLQFREEMKQKGRVTESTETQIFKEKLKRCQTSIVQLEKEKLEFKNMVIEKDALILKMKKQIAENKELIKEKDETMKKMKGDHAQEIKKIVYKNQVKYSQLSKADQDKL